MSRHDSVLDGTCPTAKRTIKKPTGRTGGLETLMQSHVYFLRLYSIVNMG